MLLMQGRWHQWHCIRQKSQLWLSRKSHCISHCIFILWFHGQWKEKNPGKQRRRIQEQICHVMHSSRNSLKKSYDGTYLWFNYVTVHQVYGPVYQVLLTANGHWKKSYQLHFSCKGYNNLSDESGHLLLLSLPCRGSGSNVLKEVWGSVDTLDVFWYVEHSVEKPACLRSRWQHENSIQNGWVSFCLSHPNCSWKSQQRQDDKAKRNSYSLLMC